MQCDTIISPKSFFITPPQSPQQPPTKITFPFHHFQPFSTLKARATLNNGAPLTKPISEMSFYELLGIPHHVEFPQIKHAYKQLVLKYHPDVSPPELVDEYTDRFIRVQEAYEILSDPRKRALYDRDMARGLHLAFSARKKMYNFDYEEAEDKSDWKGRWESQLSELKKRSMYRDAKQNSWGARMRRQRNASSS